MKCVLNVHQVPDFSDQIISIITAFSPFTYYSMDIIWTDNILWTDPLRDNVMHYLKLVFWLGTYFQALVSVLIVFYIYWNNFAMEVCEESKMNVIKCLYNLSA